MQWVVTSHYLEYSAGELWRGLAAGIGDTFHSAYAHPDFPGGAVSYHRHGQLAAHAHEAHEVSQIGGVRDLDVIHRHHHIARRDAGVLGGRARFHVETERFGKLGRQILDEHTELAPANLPVFGQLFDNRARHVARHGESDADVAA